MADDATDNRPFVLIADDDPDILTLLVYIAEKKDWRVDTATTARQIIEKVNYHCRTVGHCYDAILSDVNFFDNQPGPRLSGITAISEIRKHWSQIPVVFYTAFLNSVMRDQIRALGNTEAVEKSGKPLYGEATDAVGVINRVEVAMRWSRAKYEGRDRRQDERPPHPGRRASDCRGEIKVSDSLESALTEASALRELHATAAGGGDWGATKLAAEGK